MKRSIIAAAVFSSFFMSAGVFAADVDTGTLTIKGNIAESPCKFEAGGDSVSIKEGANKRGNSSRLTQSFHFFMFEPIFSPVNALNQPI